MSWLSRLGKGLLGAGAGFLTGGPVGAVAGGIGGAFSGGGNPFSQGSPEYEQEAGAGFDWRSILDNPLMLAGGGYGLSRLLYGGDRKRATHLANQERDFLDMILNEQRFRQQGMQPMQEMAFSRLSERMQPGSGSMLQPGGRTRYQLPEYTPGQNVSLGPIRGLKRQRLQPAGRV